MRKGVHLLFHPTTYYLWPERVHVWQTTYMRYGFVTLVVPDKPEPSPPLPFSTP